MGKKYTSISQELSTFIKKQVVFFVGTAAAEGRVNVSPKGMDSFRVLNPNTVVWLNLTGSGNETAAHLLQQPRMTIMFCAFEGKPMILRLYGTAKSYHKRDPEYDHYAPLFTENVGARQIVEMQVDLVQTSCGFAVPLMDFKAERTELDRWAEQKGEAKIKAYWEEKNTESIDGFKTNILEE